MEISAERYSVDAGAEAARAYLERTPADERIDVLMCENDVLAFGAMDVIRSEYGLRVPQDIAVVGFDNTAFAGSPTYDLTTYEQPESEMVDATIAMLLGRREKVTTYIPGRLIVRRSS